MITGIVKNLPLVWIGKGAAPESVAPNLTYTGSVWHGAVNNISGIGSVAIRTSVVNFITGKPPVTFNSISPGFFIDGTASFSSLTSLRAKGEISDLALTDRRFANLGGAFDLTLRSLDLGKTCKSADGTISTDILTKNQANWQWRGPGLKGPVTCENGDMVFNLTGRDRQQSIKATLRLQPTGQYRAIVNVVSSRAEIDAILPLYGFEKNATGYQLSEAGKWR